MPASDVLHSVHAVGDQGDDGLLEELSTAYAVALRLRRRGATDAEIASALGTDEAAIGSIVEIGQRKLDEIRRRLR